MIPGYDHEMVSPDGAVPWISGPGVVYTVLARNSFRPAIGTVDGVYQDKFLAILLLFRIDVDDSRGHGENHLATNPPGPTRWPWGLENVNSGSVISTVTSPL